MGFISGAWGVWLQVRENVGNWPVQLVSSALYVVVFFQARLFADTSLNVLYVVLYLLGWYWWLRGGENHGELHINRLSRLLGIALTGVGAAATAFLTVFLTSVHDSAPFLDALTTVMSLIALFMTGRKLLESWWVWGDSGRAGGERGRRPHRRRRWTARRATGTSRSIASWDRNLGARLWDTT